MILQIKKKKKKSYLATDLKVLGRKKEKKGNVTCGFKSV